MWSYAAVLLGGSSTNLFRWESMLGYVSGSFSNRRQLKRLLYVGQAVHGCVPALVPAAPVKQ